MRDAGTWDRTLTNPNDITMATLEPKRLEVEEE